MFTDMWMSSAALGLGLLWFCIQFGSTGAFFDWLKETPKPTPPPVHTIPAAIPSDQPPFEMRVVDEKFLAEGNQLSPLDNCHSQVIEKLRSTCAGLSEESLAKLGVALFNCQAQVEGRRTYHCTEEMSIKECTADMDGDTWNAYHIVSNRARSVCYATRQQHFRRQAELTVNALIATASSQLDAMEDLKEGQKELRELTAASLGKLLEGHNILQLQQGALKDGQEQLDISISANLQRLSQEKALISAGQELVAQLIQGISKRMENVSMQLESQGADVQDGHQAILSDLTDVRVQAQEIHNIIQDNMVEFLQQQNDTARFYSDLMGKLERMNGTLGYLLLYLDDMQGRLDERLHTIQKYLGWAGLNIRSMWVCVMHAGYFLLSAVLLSFLQCPSFCRISLLVTVPLNAIAEVNQQASFDLWTLTLFQFALSLGRWLVLQLLWVVSRLQGEMERKVPMLLPSPALKMEEIDSHQFLPAPFSTPTKDYLDNDTGFDMDCQDSFMAGDPSIVAASHLQPKLQSRLGRPSLATANHSTPMAKTRPRYQGTALESLAQRNLVGAMDTVDQSWNDSSVNQSLTSNGSVSGRPLCSATTRLGLPCKKRAVHGQAYCRVHEAGHMSQN